MLPPSSQGQSRTSQGACLLLISPLVPSQAAHTPHHMHSLEFSQLRGGLVEDLHSTFQGVGALTGQLFSRKSKHAEEGAALQRRGAVRLALQYWWPAADAFCHRHQGDQWSFRSAHSHRSQQQAELLLIPLLPNRQRHPGDRMAIMHSLCQTEEFC